MAKRDRWLKEKLTVVLEGQLSQEALEVNSEAEEMGEAEGSKAIGMEEFGTMGEGPSHQRWRSTRRGG